RHVVRARRAEGPRVARGDALAILPRGVADLDGGGPLGRRRRHARTKLELEDGGHDAEAGAKIEGQRPDVPPLLDGPDLARARARRLDAAREEGTSEPPSLTAGLDRDRADRRDRAARVDPRVPDHVPVLLGDEAAERIGGEEPAQVGA